MEKKKYDLSISNQAAENRRELISDSGKKYDVSFVPAILNRVYYKAWIEQQRKTIKGLKAFNDIQENIKTTQKVEEKDNKAIKQFIETTKEAAASGNELIIYAMRANGYKDFDENEMFSNFSEKSLPLAINFIMGIDSIEENKKKANNKA